MIVAGLIVTTAQPVMGLTSAAVGLLILTGSRYLVGRYEREP